MTAPILLDHLFIALLAAVGLYAIFRGQPKLKKELELDTPTKIGIYWSNGVILTVAGLIPCAIWLHAGRSLADLGVAWPGRLSGLAVGVTATVVVLYVVDVWWEVGSEARLARATERWRRNTPFMPTNRREMAHFSVLALSAGIMEEVIFRGYLISYLAWFTGDSFAGLAAAVTIPALGFALAHLYQGWRAVSKILALSVALGAIFLLTESLLVPIVLHVIIDFIGGYLGLRLIPPEEEEARPDTAAG